MGWKVRVEGTELRFSAAHFTTFEGQCEPLHGHNYVVTVEVEGELTEDSWVVDFVKLRKMARRICDELDHRFLLQRDSSVLDIEEEVSHWGVRFRPRGRASGQERGWALPKDEVVALPIDNSTAERLAEWFAGRLGEELRASLSGRQAAGATRVTAITVGVEEAPGQAAWYRREAG
jgi:6-pyruvoyltetrahydropterin/6-carboxytetrahydropterin synthase